MYQDTSGWWQNLVSSKEDLQSEMDSLSTQIDNLDEEIHNQFCPGWQKVLKGIPCEGSGWVYGDPLFMHDWKQFNASACKSPAFVNSWNNFYSEVKCWYRQQYNNTRLNAGDIFDQVQEYRKQINQWREKFKGSGGKPIAPALRPKDTSLWNFLGVDIPWTPILLLAGAYIFIKSMDKKDVR